jgi:probable blue pigment (indigoidine) exporter
MRRHLDRGTATASVPGGRVTEPRSPKVVRMLWVTASWGACFIAIRWGLRDAPVLWFAALRATIAGTVLLGVGAILRRPMPRTPRAWFLIGALGLVNVTIAFAAMFQAVAGHATGTAAVFSNAQPLLVLLPAWWLYGERPTRSTIAALALGFAGLVAVALPGGGGSGAGLSLLAAAAITGGTLLARLLGDVDVLVASAWQFLLGGLALAGFAWLAEGSPTINWAPRFVAVLLFMSVIGTAAAYVAWFTEAQKCRLDQLTAWTFLAPVTGIVLAATVLGERPTGWTLSGLAIVLFALAITLRPNAPQPETASTSRKRLREEVTK